MEPVKRVNKLHSVSPYEGSNANCIITAPVNLQPRGMDPLISCNIIADSYVLILYQIISLSDGWNKVIMQ